MRQKLKYILPKFFFLTGFFLFAFPAKAQSEFEKTANIVYQVGPRGNAQVSQEIELINNFSHIFPKEYQIQITGDKIKNIVAEDGDGSIISQVQEKEETTIVSLTFNNPGIGKEKSTKFFINYDLDELAVKRGLVWEISIPRLTSIKDFENFDLTIKVPETFGSLSFSSISPFSHQNLENQFVLKYQKSQLGETPILLAFGEFQVFNFDLDYTLYNNTAETAFKTIAIPPDTSYQTVFLTDINPRPIKITNDDDYNWLGVYQLDPGEQKYINVKGQAKIFPMPENSAYSQLYQNRHLNAYLRDDEYWQVNSPLIKELSNYFSRPSQIFEYVISELDYDFENLKQSERLGAIKALDLKSGVCTEFSDVFITLARASGIPARELQGFAFTENKELFTLAAENDVLHSWIEYWDQNQQIWIPADPTWTKTTEGIDFIDNFDLGHFAFVIHGHSSTKPAPPGFYKGDNEQKNVQIEFADKLIPKPEPNLEIELIKGENEAQILIKNTSLSPAYEISVIHSGWDKEIQQEEDIQYLPPLGEETFTIPQPGFWQKIFTQPDYQVVVNQKSYQLDYPYQRLSFFDFFDNLVSRFKK